MDKRSHTCTLACVHTHTHAQYHTPPPAPVTQYDFLQIPKSDPGWNISARLPRQFASTILPLSLFLSFSLLFSQKTTARKIYHFQWVLECMEATGLEFVFSSGFSCYLFVVFLFRRGMTLTEALGRRSSGETLQCYFILCCLCA